MVRQRDVDRWKGAKYVTKINKMHTAGTKEIRGHWTSSEPRFTWNKAVKTVCVCVCVCVRRVCACDICASILDSIVFVNLIIRCTITAVSKQNVRHKQNTLGLF